MTGKIGKSISRDARFRWRHIESGDNQRRRPYQPDLKVAEGICSPPAQAAELTGMRPPAHPEIQDLFRVFHAALHVLALLILASRRRTAPAEARPWKILDHHVAFIRLAVLGQVEKSRKFGPAHSW